jgi:type VI protein secretion system component VasK
MRNMGDGYASEKTKAITMTTITKSKTTVARAMIAKSVRAIAGFLEILAGVLQEVFDESAYRRFLLRGNFASSAASYAAFCAEQEKSRARRPRCC